MSLLGKPTGHTGASTLINEKTHYAVSADSGKNELSPMVLVAKSRQA